MTLFLNDKVDLREGDCRDRIRELADASIDSCVTDPPYALVSIGKRFGRSNMEQSAEAQPPNRGAQYKRLSAGFMGAKWDTGEAAFAAEFWAQVYRVLKPGGHVIAFGGTRTYHRLACAIEDAGFEIRDQIGYLYGSGFPKSHNRVIDGVTWGTGLKPAWEPIVLARKALIGTVALNIEKHGTGALNIDGTRVGSDGGTTRTNGSNAGRTRNTLHGGNFGITELAAGRWPANVILSYPEDEYQLRPGVTEAQREELYRWLSENP